MHENAFLDKALQALKDNTGITSELLGAANTPYSAAHHDHAISLSKDDVTQAFLVDIKRRPSVSQLTLLLSNDKSNLGVRNDNSEWHYGAKTLLVADYVNPKLSQFLKDNNCNFVDSAGNAYLNFGSVFVYITGNKAPEVLTETKPSRAFQSTGLKLIFALLCHPENIINRSYRDLSEISGVSLGSIGRIINDLKAAGYLSSGESDQRNWADKDGLIKRWVVAYSESLRPKLVLGYYKSLQENWQDAVDIQSYGALWGGEIAADHLTRYLKPEFSTIYTQEKLGKLVLMNGLKEVSEKSSANVEVLQKFWHFDNPQNQDLAPALLVYADLIASGNSRNIETADIIYQEFLNVSE